MAVRASKSKVRRKAISAAKAKKLSSARLTQQRKELHRKGELKTIMLRITGAKSVGDAEEVWKRVKILSIIRGEKLWKTLTLILEAGIPILEEETEE